MTPLPPPHPPPSRRALTLGALGLVALGALLLATRVRGAFIIDECHTVVTVAALREGTVFAPGTRGVTPSRAYLAFDPAAIDRAPPEGPAAPTAPPLYAPLALPFSALGWDGLVALNVLSLLGAAALLAAHARRALGPGAGAVAACTLVLGGYCLEYAQGVWPQMLSLLLVTAAFVATGRARAPEGGARWAALGGLLAGLACGVRYQNVVLAAALGLGVVLLTAGGRRVRTALAYVLGLAGPVAASAAFNRARLGSWNPLSKGPAYAEVMRPATAQEGGGEFLGTLWAKVVDFSTHPLMGIPVEGRWHWGPDAYSGVFEAHGAVKKALLQSCPWFAAALVVLALAWVGRAQGAPGARRELRAAGLCVAALLGLFGLAGYKRWDGLAFNQRYFLELLPMGAFALAAALRVEGQAGRRAALAGVAAGLALALVPLGQDAGEPTRSRALMLLPLPLALACGVAALLPRGSRAGDAARVAALCAGLGWGFAVHLGDDLPASHHVRRGHEERASAWEAVVPERAALLAWSGARAAAAPLMLERGLLVADPSLVEGRDAERVVADQLAAGRRVFVDVRSLPRALVTRLEAAFAATRSERVEGHPVLELRERPGPAP